MNRRENQVLAGVLSYLELRGDTFGWRQSTSAGVAPSGMFMRSNMRGVSDWIGLWGRKERFGSDELIVGRFLAVEAKRERGGKLSPDQERFRANIINFGGIYIEARGIDDIERVLGPVTIRIPWVRSERVVPR